jgi:hypothetical protein
MGDTINSITSVFFIYYIKDFEDGIQSGRRLMLPSEWQRFNKTRLGHLFSFDFQIAFGGRGPRM